MTMSAREDAMKRFLRKISPDRDWQYIGEVEHVWMTELYDELAAEFEGENAKLRELVAEMYEAVKCCCDECWFGYGRNPAKCENENCGYRKEYVAMRELGVEVEV